MKRSKLQQMSQDEPQYYNRRMLLKSMGYTDDEIARMLGMSVWTVKAHMRSVCKTTGLKKQRLSGWVIEKIYAVLNEPSE